MPVIAQFAVGGVIQFGSKLLALASGVILARALGASGYGVYSFALSSISLTLLICEFGMRSFQMREVSASLAQNNWTYLRGLLLYGPLIVAAAGALVGLTAALALLSLRHLFSNEALETYLLACAFLPCLALMRILLAQLTGFGLALRAQFFELLLYPAILTGGVAASFFVLRGEIGSQLAMGFQILAALVASAVIVGALTKRRPREMQGVSEASRPRTWIKGALPFLVIDAALVLHAQIDTQIIGWLGDEATVGRYRIALQLAALTTLGLSVIVQLSAPRFARLHASGDFQAVRAYYNRVQVLCVASAGLVTLGLALVGRWAIPLLFGAEYLAAYAPMVILSLGFLGNAAFGPAGTLLSMSGGERIAARWFWTSLILNIAASPFLFHHFGAVGTASASAVANTLNHLLCWLSVRRLLARDPGAKGSG